MLTDDELVNLRALGFLTPVKQPSAWFRARDAAANTLVPSELKSVGAEGVEPTVCVL